MSLVSVTMKERRERNALRRAQKRAQQRGENFIDDRIECLICKQQGASYRGLSLTSHLSNVHGMTSFDYEKELGLEEGRGQIVAPSVTDRLSTAGRRGAEHTIELMRNGRMAARNETMQLMAAIPGMPE